MTDATSASPSQTLTTLLASGQTPRQALVTLGNTLSLDELALVALRITRDDAELAQSLGVAPAMLASLAKRANMKVAILAATQSMLVRLSINAVAVLATLLCDGNAHIRLKTATQILDRVGLVAQVQNAQQPSSRASGLGDSFTGALALVYGVPG